MDKQKTPPKTTTTTSTTTKKNKKFIIAALILMGSLVIIMLSKLSKSWKTKYDSTYLNKTKTLINRSTQSYTIAYQNTNPLIALMHSSEGFSYLQAARLLLPPSELEQLTNVNTVELEEALRNQQQIAMKSIVQQIPNSKPRGKTNIVNGWLNNT